jgi:hypothetical protein
MYSTLLFNVTTQTIPRNIGVYRMASWLRDYEWDVEVVDFALNWSVDELKTLALMRINKHTKFIGFSHMFSLWSADLEEFALWIKTQYPGIVIISGSGVSPDFTSDAIDYYVQGFGEYAILELLKWLFSNGSRPRFELEKVNNKHIINANASYPAFPMKRSLVTYQARDFIGPDEWLTIEAARGCKFRCAFCNFPVLGVKGDYSRDADDFELELKTNFDTWGTKNYSIADETFNDRSEKITKFADVVEKLPFVPWFSGFLRLDLLVSRPRDKEELLRMNYLGHHYGIESFHPEAVKVVGKGMHPDRLKQGLLDMRDYYTTHGRKLYRGSMSLILGLPGESKQSLYETLDWLVENWQGQSFVPYTLSIPEVSSGSALSIMGKNLHKYGYQKLLPEEINNRDFEINVGVTTNVDSVPWKNEHMDIFDAYEIENEFRRVRRDPKNNFKLDCWQISNFWPQSTVEERLELTLNSTGFLSPASEYILKKFNYNK